MARRKSGPLLSLAKFHLTDLGISVHVGANIGIGTLVKFDTTDKKAPLPVTAKAIHGAIPEDPALPPARAQGRIPCMGQHMGLTDSTFFAHPADPHVGATIDVDMLIEFDAAYNNGRALALQLVDDDNTDLGGMLTA